KNAVRRCPTLKNHLRRVTIGWERWSAAPASISCLTILSTAELSPIVQLKLALDGRQRLRRLAGELRQDFRWSSGNVGNSQRPTEPCRQAIKAERPDRLPIDLLLTYLLMHRVIVSAADANEVSNSAIVARIVTNQAAMPHFASSVR